MLAMLRRVKAVLDAELWPDGYNIGIKDGAAVECLALRRRQALVTVRPPRPNVGVEQRCHGAPLRQER